MDVEIGGIRAQGHQISVKWEARPPSNERDRRWGGGLKIVKCYWIVSVGKGETELTKGMYKDCFIMLRLDTANLYWHMSAWFCDFPQLRLAACVSETKRKIVRLWRRQRK